MQIIFATQSLGLLIHTERKAQKLSQEQLAALTGVGIRFVRELGSWKGKLSSRAPPAGGVLARSYRVGAQSTGE